MINGDDAMYAAGFFDGEGTICLSRKKGKYPSLCIGVTNTNEEVIDFFCSTFGFSKYATDMSRYKPHYKMCYKAYLQGEKAKPFLELVACFLKVKTKQAYLALMYPTSRLGRRYSFQEKSTQLSIERKIRALNS